MLRYLKRFGGVWIARKGSTTKSCPTPREALAFLNIIPHQIPVKNRYKVTNIRLEPDEFWPNLPIRQTNSCIRCSVVDFSSHFFL